MFITKKGHFLKDNNIHILDREGRWFKRGVKKSIYSKVENRTLIKDGGLSHNLSIIFYAFLSSVPRKIKTTSHVHWGGYT